MPGRSRRPARHPGGGRVLFRTEVMAAHGDTSLEAIDVRDAATSEITLLRSGRGNAAAPDGLRA